MKIAEYISSARVKARITLRIAFKKTPPQTEKGWTKLTEAKPAARDADHVGLVEVYKDSDDSLFRAYVWSLQEMHPSAAAHYYWRKIDPADSPGRGFDYYSRSQSILG